MSKNDLSRRAALKNIGGWSLGTAVSKAFGLTPSTSKAGASLTRPVSLGLAQTTGLIHKSKAAKMLWSAWYDLSQKRRGHRRANKGFDADIASLRSVKPWAKQMMQMERERVEHEAYKRIYKVAHGHDYDDYDDDY